MGCAFLNEKFSICRNLKCSCVSKCWHPDKNTHGAPDGLEGWLANESRSLPSHYKINWMPFGVKIESRSDSWSEFSSRKPNSEKKIKPTHLVTSRRPCPTFIRVGCCTHQAGMLSEELILPNLVTACKLTCQTNWLNVWFKSWFWFRAISWNYITMSPFHCDSFFCSQMLIDVSYFWHSLAHNLDWQLLCCQNIADN